MNADLNLYIKTIIKSCYIKLLPTVILSFKILFNIKLAKYIKVSKVTNIQT